jgi:signal transduction histidine kinase
MRIALGLPNAAVESTLPRRLAILTGARLALLALSLGLVGLLYIRAKFGSFTLQVALGTLVVAFMLGGLYAGILRLGRGLTLLASTQLVVDQLTWTVVAFLTGGAASGAVSFYGLSCVMGAALIGFRGAVIAAVAGIACYSAMVALLASGGLSPPPDQPLSIYSISSAEARFYVAVNGLVQLVLAVLAGTLAERLRWTGGELVLATERAERAERMAALGRLAAGLAHEIRNPLGSIAGSAQLLKASRSLSDEDKQLCDIIRREASRLNDLVTDMIDLSRPRPLQLLPVDAAVVAREVVGLAGTSGRSESDVGVVYEGPPSVQVRADAAQLRQLIWNLVRNAVQASSAGERVRVVVTRHPDDRVELAVIDRGVGIDEAARGRIFDAFFTTRSQGTGVGLALVKRIADEHGFPIEVESGAGRGATFRVGLGNAVALSLAPANEA